LWRAPARRTPTRPRARGREQATQTRDRRPGAKPPALTGQVGKTLVTAAARRAVVAEWRAAAGLSERRACRFLGTARSSQRYRGRRVQPPGLRERLTELAAARPRWGYRRLWVLLRREGYAVNWKRVYRLYREAGLAVQRRRRKRRGGAPAPPAGHAAERAVVAGSCARWPDPRALVSQAHDRGRLHPGVPGDRGGRLAHRGARRGSPHAARPGTPLGSDDRRGQRAGVCGPGARCLGVSTWDHAGLHSTREADAERLRGEFQQPAARRVPQRPLVCDGDGGAADDRSLAGRLQHPTSARLTRPPHPERIRGRLEGGNPRPDIVILRSKLDQKWGAPHPRRAQHRRRVLRPRRAR